MFIPQLPRENERHNHLGIRIVAIRSRSSAAYFAIVYSSSLGSADSGVPHHFSRRAELFLWCFYIGDVIAGIFWSLTKMFLALFIIIFRRYMERYYKEKIKTGEIPSTSHIKRFRGLKGLNHTDVIKTQVQTPEKPVILVPKTPVSGPPARALAHSHAPGIAKVWSSRARRLDMFPFGRSDLAKKQRKLVLTPVFISYREQHFPMSRFLSEDDDNRILVTVIYREVQEARSCSCFGNACPPVASLPCC
jgi:hypothetical protein